METKVRVGATWIDASYFFGPRGIFRGIDPVKNLAPLETTEYMFNSRNILFTGCIRRPLTGLVRKFAYI
ncbi:MAG: hypothetical protein AAB899_03235 [Patescibacteria group bacterium]